MPDNNFLKKDIGGLPVWGWGLIVVGGVGAGLLLMKFTGGNNPFSGLASAGTNSAGQAGTSEAAGALNGQSGNGTVPTTYNTPDQGFAQTTLNGQQVPILPPGYQPLTDSSGNVIGYGPATGATTSTNGVATTTTTTGGGTTTPSSSKTATTTKSATLESSPNDTKGGHNITTVPSGASVQFVSGPVADPAGRGKQYYKVVYSGQTGYIGSDSLPGNPFSGNGGGASERTYQTNVLGV